MYRLVSYGSIIVLAAWIVYLYLKNIHVFPLDNWDEAFYADSIRWMVRTEDYIMPYWNSSLFIDKPPFYFWVSALFVKLFGYTEMSYRLPSVLAAFGIISLTFWHLYKKQNIPGAILAVFWLISNILFVYRNRDGNLDSMATLFILGSYLALIWKSKYKYIAWGICVGLVYLTKASLAFYLFPAILIALYVNSNTLKEKGIFLLQGGISFLAVVLVWLIPLYFQQGSQIVSYYLFGSDQGVASLTLKNISQVYTGFLLEASSKYFIVLSLIGFILLFKNWKKNLLLYYYSFSLLALLSLSSVHYHWYLIPILPFWAIASGEGLKLTAKAIKNKSEILQKAFIVATIFIALLQHLRIYERSLNTIISYRSTENQKQAALFLKQLPLNKALVVRTDVLSPVTVYYSEKQIYMSSLNEDITRAFFISRNDLCSRIKNGPVIFSGHQDEIRTISSGCKTQPAKVLFKKNEEVIAVNQLYNLPASTPQKPGIKE